jgi:alpha-glucosidase
VAGSTLDFALDATWWKYGTIYQVYPRSFLDTNGDGIGDLEGILRRLDYLVWLGIEAVWLSPLYPSPMADFGYDITDHCDIDPIFGDFADFTRLIDEAHRRNIRIILDLVPNHTSDQHPWFLDSRRSRVSQRRNWYIWRDGKPGGGPPNNWISNFGGSAWELDRTTGQYYYHAFLKQQPDLNWRNAQVRAAMHAVMRFWLDRGVDGFRVDVLWHLMKDAAFRDNPSNPAYAAGQPDINRLLPLYSADQPEIAGIISELRGVLDQYADRVLIGEIYLPVERLVSYYGENLAGVHLPFNFQLLFTAWHAAALAALIDEYEGLLPAGAWPNWVLGNHDQKRVATRLGGDQARVAAMLLLTLRGTPTLYYGDEIGMTDVPIPAEAVQDPWARNEPGLGFGRDPQRTPMQWDASRLAGFSAHVPWLPIGADYERSNVARQKDDPASMLSLYRNLIALRHRTPALRRGSYWPLAVGEHVLAYERVAEGERVLVALNLANGLRQIQLPSWVGNHLLLSTHGDQSSALAEQRLQANEGIIVGDGSPSPISTAGAV